MRAFRHSELARLDVSRPGWTARGTFASLPRVRYLAGLALVLGTAAGLAGCGSAPSPESAPPPSQTPVKISPPVITEAADSVASIPGSPDAQFIFRFRQAAPGGGAGFTHRDRDLSFFFRPTPSALFFQVENLQGRPVWIDWEHSQFVDTFERRGKIGHSTIRWKDRYTPQAQTQVPPQQRYSDYVFPLDYLLDPGADEDTQLRRPLLPEDASAVTYAGKVFGVDLVFLVENQPRTYSFRYEVASVIPR